MVPRRRFAGRFSTASANHRSPWERRIGPPGLSARWLRFVHPAFVEVSLPEIIGVAHVELSVRDLDASVAWYTRLLGAQDVFRAESEAWGITACAVYELRSHLVLAFTQHFSQEPEAFSPRRAGLDHLSFGVANRPALEAWVAWLDELGIVHSPIQDDQVPVSVTFSDPDGIALELSYRPPRDR